VPSAPDRTNAAPPPVAAKATKPVPRKRVPAEERREDVLSIAAQVVARDGMHAASTAEIARLSGMSHAYLFRLFPTKEDLLLEVARRCCVTMRQEMIGAGETAKAAGEDPLAAMGLRWLELLEDRVLLQVSLQSISAAHGMPALGAQLRDSWELIVTDIERVSEAPVDEVRAFIAEGMLLKIISGLGAEQAPWVERLHHGPLPCTPEEMHDGLREIAVIRRD
jgi:AcrR family transcriptional regulator